MVHIRKKCKAIRTISIIFPELCFPLLTIMPILTNIVLAILSVYCLYIVCILSVPDGPLIATGVVVVVVVVVVVAKKAKILRRILCYI